MAGSLFYLIILAAAVCVAAMVAVFLFEVMAFFVIPRKDTSKFADGKPLGRIAVLIPAHNEEDSIARTIISIRPQLRKDDVLLVIADNCTDLTASVARQLGADVAIRTDPQKRGKGFALDFGIRHLAKDPPEIVIVVDADCRVGDSGIDRLSALCAATNRPVQARYIMQAADPLPSSRIREFAWRVRNWIRPKGLNNVGMPCQLMGTGMAFSWGVIVSANLENSSLVEDLKLGLELAAAGFPPHFCPAATVTSEFPVTIRGTETQRHRWRKGHLATIAFKLPALLMNLLRRPNPGLFVLILDAAVPPLSFLMITSTAVLLATFLSWIIGLGGMALLISMVSISGFALAVAACWVACGKDVLPPRYLLTVGMYVFQSIPMYVSIMFDRSRSAWVRTDRQKR